ncbi:hypothetical protein BCR44DRAFT_1426426, partial [Catenaria anguillulae PL171]
GAGAKAGGGRGPRSAHARLRAWLADGGRRVRGSWLRSRSGQYGSGAASCRSGAAVPARAWLRRARSWSEGGGGVGRASGSLLKRTCTAGPSLAASVLGVSPDTNLDATTAFANVATVTSVAAVTTERRSRAEQSERGDHINAD